MKLGGTWATASAIVLIWLAEPWSGAAAQTPNAAPAPLHRAYGEGQVLHYRMKGINEAWHYSVEASGTVKKDGNGAFYEEFAWSNLVSDGKPEPLSAGMAGYRQRLSLDPKVFPGAPSLTGVDPKMIGPVTDLMTFYVDYWLAAKFNQLQKAGDHFDGSVGMQVNGPIRGNSTPFGAAGRITEQVPAVRLATNTVPALISFTNTSPSKPV